MSADRIHMYNTIAHNLADRIRAAPNLARADLFVRNEWEPHLSQATEEGISVAAMQSLFRSIIDPALTEHRNRASKELIRQGMVDFTRSVQPNNTSAARDAFRERFLTDTSTSVTGSANHPLALNALENYIAPRMGEAEADAPAASAAQAAPVPAPAAAPRAPAAPVVENDPSDENIIDSTDVRHGHGHRRRKAAPVVEVEPSDENIIDSTDVRYGHRRRHP